MDFEPWWLIFVPVLFALGWLQAMQEQAQTRAETTFKKLANAGRLKKKKASAR